MPDKFFRGWMYGTSLLRKRIADVRLAEPLPINEPPVLRRPVADYDCCPWLPVCGPALASTTNPIFAIQIGVLSAAATTDYANDVRNLHVWRNHAIEGSFIASILYLATHGSVF
jgi:hypothetical protein